ncbi:hypothetical protein [Aminiphilus circumscriptus]|jgi:hypothetical protein|uniref:hypothetical protein n=1 Tax=Aminiphilus circumscriptus TaxID=290732 RepID=UPI0004927BA4|nr:hypothetical protein [Aminiphilus circumscriptus]
MVDAERNITPAHNSEDAAAAAAFSPVDTEAEGAFPAESPMVAPGSNAREGGSISFEELARLLHCSPEDVQATAATLDKDPDKAREMLKSLAPAYLAVKGRFEARRRGEVNGGFCIVADGHSGTLVDSVVWVGTYELPQGFTARASWESVRAALTGISAFPDRLMYRKIQSILEPLLTPTAMNVLFQSSDAMATFVTRLKESLSDQFRMEFIVDVHMERFNRLRLDMSSLGKKQEERKEEPKESSPPKESRSGIEEIKIFCAPVLDPVRGKPVSALRVGDVVEVSFEQAQGLGRFIGRLISRSGLVPAFAVEEVRPLPTGDISVRLSISEGIVGAMKLSPTYRIRLHSSKYNVFRRSILSLKLFIQVGLFIAAVLLLLFGVYWFFFLE